MEKNRHVHLPVRTPIKVARIARGSRTEAIKQTNRELAEIVFPLCSRVEMGESERAKMKNFFAKRGNASIENRKKIYSIYSRFLSLCHLLSYFFPSLSLV